ncbi:MAG: LacI family DNA-binding transcriptional regulator [Chloroflexota bacterium]
MKKNTIHDVAELAGVSSATVSYILSGRRSQKSRISEATKERVLEAAGQLNYSPNAAARNLRRRRTDRICLVMPTLSPFNTLFVSRMQDAADQHGYFTITALAGSEQREIQIFNELRRGFVDGAVLLGTHFLNHGHFRQLADAGLALVVSRDENESDGYDVIHINEEGASRKAVNHLIEKGHSCIAIFGDLSNILQRQKMERYRCLLEEYAIRVSPGYFRGDAVGRRSTYDITRRLKEWEVPPTAILAVSDRAAIGSILGARDAGIRVPEELAVIGFGNIPETEITTPALSTIGQPSIDFQPFADLLFSRLAAEEPLADRVIELNNCLILRGSA